MNVKTNVKINYMLLEQVLRVTGTYKNLCEEYEYLDYIFKKTKTGKMADLFKSNEAFNDVLEFLEKITGVPKKYWAGDERIKLGIRYNNDELNYDGKSIDTVDLADDAQYINNATYINSETGEDEAATGHAYHGVLYQEILKNPLHLDYEEIYIKVNGNESSEDEILEGEETVETLYSLRGLLSVILINMALADEIELIDKANVYQRTSWEPYMRHLKKPTQHAITYSPKYIEIRKGLVQTMIKNILDLGYVVTFRDLEKNISI